MKITSLPITRVLIALFISFFVLSCASAQQWSKIDVDEWCCDDDRDEKYCEVREITLSSDRSLISVDGRTNGGIEVEGWNRNEIRLRAKICAWDRDRDDAKRRVAEIEITTRGKIKAEGPSQRRRRGWSVSYQLMVPNESNLRLETLNGGITINNVVGEIDFDATNGGIQLSQVGGDVRGRTTNGGLAVELQGREWDGRGLDVQTTNGGVTLEIPDRYSANLETGTVNGKIHADFPITVQGTIGRKFSTTLGDGGKTIRATTTNGSVTLRRY